MDSTLFVKIFGPKQINCWWQTSTIPGSFTYFLLILHCVILPHLICARCVIRLIIFHLHPLCYVVKVIKTEKGVFQSCDGTIGIQQATHVEFVTVPLVSRARSTANQRQRFPLEVTRQHGGRGAGTRLWLICRRTRKENICCQPQPTSTWSHILMNLDFWLRFFLFLQNYQTPDFWTKVCALTFLTKYHIQSLHTIMADGLQYVYVECMMSSNGKQSCKIEPQYKLTQADLLGHKV